MKRVRKPNAAAAGAGAAAVVTAAAAGDTEDGVVAAGVEVGIAAIGEIAETAGRKSANSLAAIIQRPPQCWQVCVGILPFYYFSVTFLAVM